MAALICVCLVLALWMTGSRPLAAGHRSGLPDSGLRWDQAYLETTAQALRYWKAGDLRAAERAYRSGLDKSLERADRLATVRFLMSIGACQLMRFEYRNALAAFLTAREQAADMQDAVDLSAIEGNLSSLYLQMWDIPAARQAAQEGLRIGEALPAAYSIPGLLLQMGQIEALTKSPDAESYYQRGIDAARRRGDLPTEARGWDWLGDAQFARDALREAEKSYMEGLRLRLQDKTADLAHSYGRLGALRLAQGNLEQADHFTGLAQQLVRAGKPGWSDRLLRHQQGSIHLARGQVDEALEDFSESIDATARWRLNALPSRSALTSVNTGLEEKMFRSFIELAASHAVQTRNSVWSERAFQALELNRAASLRESITFADVWREKLPPEYWEILGRLDAEQTKILRTGHDDGSAARLHLKITEMEASAGLGFAVKKYENFRIQSSLNHFQAGLGKSELFLTFFLGRDSSYLWAVSRESLHVYRLAAEQEIAAHAAAFRQAVVESRSTANGRDNKEAETLRVEGRRLYEELFGSLDAGEKAKKNWLLSLEGALFEVPFAALREPAGGETVFLVERHSIQVVPGALLLSKPEDRPGAHGLFLGVGDPIYNAADVRWTQPEAPVEAASIAAAPGQLVRLIASGDEVRASAAVWQRQSGTATILEGFQARLDGFVEQLHRGPRVIHLATHVLFGGDGPARPISSEATREQAFVAFSIPRKGWSEGPQYLTTARISTLRVPGAFVVMTGCAAGTGDVRAGAGLLGLTRAWLMAGASGVLATAWPVEDSPGEIFSRFYRYFPETPAAEALRRSQVDMLHRTAPSQWASYQLTGGLR